MRTLTRTELFSEAPVRSAVATLIVPTIISQLIAIVYNLADIFFVGQLGDPTKVAAVSLVLPAFMVLTTVGNLFGMGGAGAVARALGRKEDERAASISAFSFYAALSVVLLVGALLLIFSDGILRFLGASPDTKPYAAQYVFFVMVLGGAPTSLSICLAHMIRADGGARQAGFGLSMGGIINIALDPLFILVFKWGVAGAAAATMLSNVCSLLYFLLVMRRRRAVTVLSLKPAQVRVSWTQVVQPVIASGLPASLQTLSVSVFYMFLNKLGATYGDVMVAAIGITQKLDMIPQYVTLGISQGILPLLGYNYAAKNYDRMNESLRFARRIAILFSLICLAVFQLLAGRLVWLFIQDAETVRLGTTVLRIMCLCTPSMAYCNVSNGLFLAIGKARQALIIAFFRRLYFAIPMLYLLNWLLPPYGIVMTQPIVDFLAIFLTAYLSRRFLKQLKAAAPQLA